MSNKAEQSGSRLSANVSCLRPGIQESDTADSGEESEPTYRHYDNFETDVCLTQDEDDEPLVSNIPIVRDLASNLTPTQARKTPTEIQREPRPEARDPIPRDNFPVVSNMNRGVSSDSDSCTENELPAGQAGQTTDDTTTSTSESEETQIWVPVSKRPSARHVTDTTTTPPASATSSNGSDHSRPQSFIHKAGTPGPRQSNSVGSLTIIASPGTVGPIERTGTGGMSISSDGGVGIARRDSRDSWQTLQANIQSSGVQKRVSPTKQVSLGVLRHDENTGTITLDIRNLPNGDSGLGHDEDGFSPSEDGATGSILRPGYSRANTNTSFTDTLCMLCSGLYMLLVVVLGLIVPVAEIFADRPFPVLFEGFYIYLHVVSIAYLVYAYTYLVRLRTMPPSRRGRTIVSSVPVQNRKRNGFIDDVIQRQTGSFYLRLGAVGFGIGSMIKSGLHFGEYFEMTSSLCSHVLYGIRPLLHLCFTFIQLYFVFLNAKMFTHRYRLLSRFGLMHMVATNMAVWLENVVKETLRELGRIESSDTMSKNKTEALPIRPKLGQDGGATYTPVRMTEVYPGSDCYGDSLMGEVVETSSPFLYPCTILYCLICTGILFVMWLRLGSVERKTDNQSEGSGSSERANVDCSSSSRGLFLGIIVFVAAVIILITFFVLVRTVEFMDTAVRLDHLGDVSIYVLTTVSAILAFHRIHALRNITTDGPGFEDVLMVISLVGVYVLCLSNIVAGALTDMDKYGHLIILSNSFRIVQATVQTVFLLNTLRRRAWKKEQEISKPGREFVTFLLICNIALWGMNIFEVQRSNANPIQSSFYGHIGWSIITHLSVPMAIFFRFHSTVCLANIWKHAWRYKS